MTLIDWLFVLRLFPLMFAGFIATRAGNFIGVGICTLYICVTTVNYLYKDPALNAVFSTPLVFLTAWYIIKTNRRQYGKGSKFEQDSIGKATRQKSN